MGARSGNAAVGRSQLARPIRFDGRLRWRRTRLFKLCANAIWCRSYRADNQLRGKVTAAIKRARIENLHSPNSCATHNRWAGV